MILHSVAESGSVAYTLPMPPMQDFYESTPQSTATEWEHSDHDHLSVHDSCNWNAMNTDQFDPMSGHNQDVMVGVQSLNMAEGLFAPQERSFTHATNNDIIFSAEHGTYGTLHRYTS